MQAFEAAAPGSLSPPGAHSNTQFYWQEGKEDQPLQVGEAATVPFKQIHMAITQEQGATVLVFRVHEKGQPGGTLVE